MTRIRLKYVHTFVDRHGKTRQYFRRAGQARIPLPGLPGSRAFMEAYQAALDNNMEDHGVGLHRSKAGSISALIAAFYRSPDFMQLASATKVTYRGMLERFRADHGDKPVAALEAVHVRKMLHAKASTPSAANNFVRMVHLLMAFGVDLGWRKDDPTVGVRKLKQPPGGHHTWTEEEIQQFEQRWALGTRERLAFDLLLYTAQRISDVRIMGKQHFDDGILQIRQQKTGTLVRIPMHPTLRRSIDAAATGSLTYLVTKAGKPFTPAGISNWFKDAVTAAAIGNKATAHGLRKAAARRLAEAGCTPHEIMAVTGHLSLKEVERYTRAANKTELAKAAMSKIK